MIQRRWSLGEWQLVYIMAKQITTIANNINMLIEETCKKISTTYLTELAKQPQSYIIYSVWGVSAEGELTEIQKAIHHTLQPTVEQIFQSLSLQDPNTERKMGIEYLIRDLIISKMFFMAVLFKATVRKIETSEQSCRNNLNDVEVMGHA